jgi:hypothetical protein
VISNPFYDPLSEPRIKKINKNKCFSYSRNQGDLAHRICQAVLHRLQFTISFSSAMHSSWWHTFISIKCAFSLSAAGVVKRMVTLKWCSSIISQ